MVAARNVRRRQHRFEPVGIAIGGKVAEGEAGVGVGRADHLHHQRAGGGDVVAEALGARDLAAAVDPRDRVADVAVAVAGGCAGNIEHGGDDLPVAGAAAEDAGERFLHGGGIRRGVAPEERCGGDQHPRRADAALRCAMAQERCRESLADRRGAQRGDGVDGATLGLTGADEAGAHRLARQEHGAGAAVARVAADLHVPRAEPFAQHLAEPLAGRAVMRDGRAVEGEPGRNAIQRAGEGFAHAGTFEALAMVRRTSSSAASTRNSAVERTSPIGDSGSRCSAETAAGASSTAVPTSAASSAARRTATARAGADRDAGACDPPALGLKHRADHRDGNHEIAPRAELDERALRGFAVRRHEDRRHHLAGGEGRAARAGEELAERHGARAAGARDLHGRAERQERGDAVRRGGGVAQVAGDRAGVLDLHGTHFARRGLQAVECRRERGADDVGPGGGGADAPAAGSGGDAAQALDAGDVHDRERQGTVAEGGVKVGAAGENARVRIAKGGQSLVNCSRAVV